MVDAGQDANFVDGILFVLVRLGADLHLFEGIDLTVLYTSDLVNTRVGTIAKLLHDHEVSKLCSLLVLHFVRLAEAGMTSLLLASLNVESLSNQICCRLLTIRI